MKLTTTFISVFLAAGSFTAPLLTGCAGGRAALMTPEEISAHGTHRFAAPPAQTFAATIGALQTLGYDVAVANEEKGMIKTARKDLRAQAVAAGNTAIAVSVYRQYYIRIESTDPTNTTVVAEPKVFIGERDISADKVWALEGPEGERELWKRLFAEIESNL